MKVGDRVIIRDGSNKDGRAGTIRFQLAQSFAIELDEAVGVCHPCESEGELRVPSGRGWWVQARHLEPLASTPFEQSVRDYIWGELDV